jgi:hypothetical protein
MHLHRLQLYLMVAECVSLQARVVVINPVELETNVTVHFDGLAELGCSHFCVTELDLRDRQRRSFNSEATDSVLLSILTLVRYCNLDSACGL